MSDSLFLEQSLMRASWVLPSIPMDDIQHMARQHDLPEIVARLLCARGVSVEDAKKFLFPTLKSDFPDPLSLKDMEATANYLAFAIMKKRSIAIFGDFDVDGATSSALMHRFLKHFGVNAPIYSPDRRTEGYGPNIEALRGLKAQGVEILVLLDCGTTAFEVMTQAKETGLEIVIVDHHEAEARLPDVTHIVNPKRKDDISGLTMLAACGVTFMLCVAVNGALRKAEFYETTQITEPPLKDWLDIVALGTVCDMVPLTGVNRLFIRAGFNNIIKGKNVGIQALLDVAKVNGAPTTYHAGFVLGPRINAGGRVHKADLGAKLLSTNDPEEAKNIAWLLNDCNDKRKTLQVQMEQEAMDKIEQLGLQNDPVIIIEDKNWHPGLVGLMAGRLKEKYGRPACVIAYAENGEGRGSGRSIPGVHIAQAFIDARTAGLLEKGGGHAMAGGFTIQPGKLDAFRAFMKDHISKQVGSGAPQVRTIIDGVLSPRGLRADFVRLINENIGPFGQEAPEPIFMLSQVRLHDVSIMGVSHIRAMASDWEGGPRVKVVAFRAVGTPLGDALLKQGRQPFHLLGQLKLDTWNGREQVEFHIRDATFAQASAEEVMAG